MEAPLIWNGYDRGVVKEVEPPVTAGEILETVFEGAGLCYLDSVN